MLQQKHVQIYSNIFKKYDEIYIGEAIQSSVVVVSKVVDNTRVHGINSPH